MNNKQYQITISVDIEQLSQVYCEAQNLTLEELEVNNITPLVMLETELAWVAPSGVQLIGEIKEVNQQ